MFSKEKVKSVKILVIGDVMLDRYWFGSVDRISPEAPVPVVHIKKSDDCLGGAANVARNIKSLGAQVSLVGIIGQDDAGRKIQQLAVDEGIHAHFVVDEKLPTTLKLRILGGQQQLLRIDFEDKPHADTLKQIQNNLERLLDEHDVLVLSDYAKGVLNDVPALIAYAKSKHKLILVDPKGTDYDRYIGASLVTPNRSEMRQAVGAWADEATLTEKADRLLKHLKLEALLVTKSEQGMTLYTENNRFHVDANAHEVFDVSGAGDTVLATLAVSKAMGMSWEDAIYWANIAGGIVVGKLGTSTITAEELNQFVKESEILAQQI
ncbi:D-glycero-beta-D-manno-heptose-7-phosphate kinase [Basilea psittacipulmonis]|uniref:D-glycero-beta-D-manno-heptose-7-phosphate kinase n=1 Tax=Basilea psittacipulmonis TaxID=1472345 RepID=UPI00068B91DC|nr:D-glycero-beta-D-manno-heptose-7-phosphate kinase [Basilea psittacipulmonis]